MVRIAKVKRSIAQSKWYYALFALPFLYYVVFHYVPMFGVIIAFKEYDLFQGVFRSPWAGTKYFELFLTDPYFYKIFKNTLILGFYEILFIFTAPIGLALLLNELKNQLFKRIIQTVSYLPHFLSTVVVVGMIVNFMAADGVINEILKGLGYAPVNFLMLPEWFRTIYISSGIWQTIGWGSIIYLAALTNVNPELYEAANMDGANRWDKTVHVTIPGITPVIIILLLFNIGSILTVSFEKILLLYNGSTYETADVIATYVYRRGLLGADFSYATAVGLFNSVVALCFLVTANRISRKVSETSLW